MYLIVLIIHSWLRWAALLLGVFATYVAYKHRGDTSERPPGQRLDWWFMLVIDLQAFTGLVLYFGYSPFTLMAMNDVSSALREPHLFYWSITHAALMLVGVITVRAGRIYAMGELPSGARRNGRYISFAIAVLTMAAGVPWPGLSVARPLFRY